MLPIEFLLRAGQQRRLTVQIITSKIIISPPTTRYPVNRKRPPIPQLPTTQRARRRWNKRCGNPPPNNKKSCKARRQRSDAQQSRWGPVAGLSQGRSCHCQSLAVVVDPLLWSSSLLVGNGCSNNGVTRGRDRVRGGPQSTPLPR